MPSCLRQNWLERSRTLTGCVLVSDPVICRVGAIRFEAVANTWFCDQVTGSGWVGFEFVSQVGDVYAKIVGFCFVGWPPDLLEGLSLGDKPARVADQDWGVPMILDRDSRLRGSVHARATPEVQPAVRQLVLDKRVHDGLLSPAEAGWAFR